MKAGPSRRWLVLMPLLVAQGPAPDPQPVIAQLRFARAMLCGTCNDDLERDGVNRPARRSMIGSDKLLTAREMLDATPGLRGAAEARRQIDAAVGLLEGWDESAAIRAIDAAIRALRGRRSRS